MPGFPAPRALAETDLSQVQEEAGVLAGLGKVGEKDCDADEQHCGVLTHLSQGLQGKGWGMRKNIFKFGLIALKNLQLQRQPNQGHNTLKISRAKANIKHCQHAGTQQQVTHSEWVSLFPGDWGSPGDWAHLLRQ